MHEHKHSHSIVEEQVERELLPDELINNRAYFSVKNSRALTKGSFNPRLTVTEQQFDVIPGNCSMEKTDLIEQKKMQALSARKKLLMITGVCLIFMLVEIIGGYMANSIAIMTDAAHMLSDVSGFMISYLAIYLGGKPATFDLSFGYHRAEVLGALTSILIIWGLIIWLFVEAIIRFVYPEEVDGEVMLVTSIVGLVCNIINIFLLHGISLNCCKKGKKEKCSHSHGEHESH